MRQPSPSLKTAADALLRVIVKSDRARLDAKLASSKGRPTMALGRLGATDGLDVAGLTTDPAGTACRAELRRIGHVFHAINPDDDLVALSAEIAEMDQAHASWRASALETAWAGLGKRIQPPRSEDADPALTPSPAKVEFNQAPLAYSFADAGKMLGVSRSMIYAVVAEGQLPARQIGARRLIRHSDLKAFFDNLPPGGPKAKR